MKSEEIKIGMSVKVKSSSDYSHLHGKIGIIKSQESPSDSGVAVEFPGWTMGHDCNGFTEINSGYWVEIEDLIIVLTILTEDKKQTLDNLVERLKTIGDTNNEIKS